MKLIVTLLLFALLPAVAQKTDATKESTETLIEKLRKDPTDLGRIGVLAKRKDDPQVIPALRELFAHAKLSEAKRSLDTVSLRPTQIVALQLYKLGVDENLYIDELIHYARQAIAADPPVAFATDADGKEVPSNGHNPAFDAWCATRGLDFTSCWYTVINLGNDLNLLRGVMDKRAVMVFRDALQMSNYAFVGKTAYTLAEWNDKASIPVIAQACSRFPPHQAESIAINATRFNDSAIEQVFDLCIKEPQTRAKVKQEWRERLSKRPRHSPPPP